MPTPPERTPGHWLPVWTLIFEAAEELRRSRAEVERQAQIETTGEQPET